MKFATAAPFFLAAVSPAFAYTKVNIDVKCKGAKIDKLGVADTTVVANALESAYNAVHSEADNDDSQLYDVHYGYWAGEADFLQQGGGYG